MSDFFDMFAALVDVIESVDDEEALRKERRAIREARRIRQYRRLIQDVEDDGDILEIDTDPLGINLVETGLVRVGNRSIAVGLDTQGAHQVL